MASKRKKKSELEIQRPQGGGTQPGNRAKAAVAACDAYGVNPAQMLLSIINGGATCMDCHGKGKVTVLHSLHIKKLRETPELIEIGDKLVDCPGCLGRGQMRPEIKDQLWAVGKLGDWYHPKPKPVDSEKDKGSGRPQVHRYGHDSQMKKRIEDEKSQGVKEKMKLLLAVATNVEHDENQGGEH